MHDGAFQVGRRSKGRMRGQVGGSGVVLVRMGRVSGICS